MSFANHGSGYNSDQKSSNQGSSKRLTAAAGNSSSNSSSSDVVRTDFSGLFSSSNAHPPPPLPLPPAPLTSSAAGGRVRTRNNSQTQKPLALLRGQAPPHSLYLGGGMGPSAPTGDFAPGCELQVCPSTPSTIDTQAYFLLVSKKTQGQGMKKMFRP